MVAEIIARVAQHVILETPRDVMVVQNVALDVPSVRVAQSVASQALSVVRIAHPDRLTIARAMESMVAHPDRLTMTIRGEIAGTCIAATTLGHRPDTQ